MADDRREGGATRLGNLAEVAGRLTSSLEPKEVAWAAASAIGQAMASASCSVYEYSAVHELLMLKATWSLNAGNA